ncbi:Stk1 family PASTA domain-containing Ser/Thr kinase [Streptomyces sp. TRM 70361]|uniref:Stk1 family PASTA domain-containing Ser/Thr kinase n=1 Tax=Streptomyces sp. TRM 70361 TaxID=3116553 RepID=UPI002E7BCF4F|nr:Stk1 family PASTA domain-containing Ser/Thr kinase [Streptomyces sp. TRM 70361]MEE1939495.1 Stk1 family PASTA domain-containing Ser/Thr kinase [Streptomyces sp. TRM 70361]
MEEPRRLGGRYELGSVLGRGGMAEVYLAHDTRLGRTVAVKTLRVDLARDPTFQARFRREAQSAASLNHPAIVAVYDTGEDYVDGVSIPYIVMEYVDGSTLRELLHSGRKLLPERSLEMCVGILQALEYSHRNGIVHRDIKPANVMLTRTGQVKVMDFGIARAMGDSGMTMTQTAAVIGTAQYLSPEQAKGETVDARSDLYSTGCLLYELLTVRPPFVGDSPVAVAYQHVREEPQPPSIYDPEITPEMDAIVLKALEKDPDYRYQSADEMRADIEAALDGQPVGAAAAMGMGAAAYNGYHPDDQPTTALRAAAPPTDRTSMLPPMREDDGGYGYDERPDRRRQNQKNHLSTVLLVLGGILVLVGAVFIGKVIFSPSDSDPSVPDLTGLTLSQAEQRATNARLKVSKGPEEFCAEEEGTVCKTDPAEGEQVPEGSTITLIMSKGPAEVEIPDVVGEEFDEARQELENANFEVKRETEVSEQPPGTVIEQDPAGGGKAKPGTEITLTVAEEDERPTVPNVVDQDFEAAKNQLEELGFTVVRTDQEDTSREPNTVISQSITPNTKAAPNSTITLTVAKAPEQPEEEPATVPNVQGQRLAEAQQALQNAGFQVRVDGPQGENARVLSTDPGAGTEARKGDTVTVRTFSTGGPGGNGGNGGPGGDDGNGGPGGFFGFD